MERPKAESVQRLDEEWVRATEWRFRPGAETGWHSHAHDYVIVPLTDGTLLLELPDDQTAHAALIACLPYARRLGVEHNVVNAGDSELRFLEIEIVRNG